MSEPHGIRLLDLHAQAVALPSFARCHAGRHNTSAPEWDALHEARIEAETERVQKALAEQEAALAKARQGPVEKRGCRCAWTSGAFPLLEIGGRMIRIHRRHGGWLWSYQPPKGRKVSHGPFRSREAAVAAARRALEG